jgi:vancomycin resistance protein YoaR
MADNSNPRTQSVKDAMVAEIVVKELSKFTESHELIMESTQKILSRYNDIGMLIEQMDKRDHAIAQCIKNMQLSTDEYLKLTELSMKMASELKEIDEDGIGIEPDSLNKVIKAVQEANKPMREHIRWLTYGVITAFGMLLLIGLLL